MKKGEKGFVLIEMVVVIAFLALITGAVTMTVSQVIRGTERSSNQMTVINQVENAVSWISYDAGKAQNVIVDGLNPPDFLILTWTEWDSGDEYQVTYTLEDMAGSELELKELQRRLFINGGSKTTTFVAQYIDPETKCEFENGTLTVTVTATVSTGSQTRSETRVCRVVPRPN